MDAIADLTCPLCGYSLRGLVDPRCPECGFAFDWDELRAADRDRHPWLFEHARRRRVRAFLSTYVRSAFPRRFWRAVKPSNPVRMGRLVLYWLIASTVLLVPVVGPPVPWLLKLARNDRAVRALYTAMPGAGTYQGPELNDDTWYMMASSMRHQMPSSVSLAIVTADQLDEAAPRVPSANFILQAWRQSHQVSQAFSDYGRSAVAAAIVLFLWPWSLSIALMVFQASMRRATIRRSHVLRAAVYGCDVALLTACIATVLCYAHMPVTAATFGTGGFGPPPAVTLAEQIPTGPFEGSARPVLLALAFCATASTYRVWVAYRRYLRFPHPLATVVASQFIVLLVVFLTLMWTTNLIAAR